MSMLAIAGVAGCEDKKPSAPPTATRAPASGAAASAPSPGESAVTSKDGTKIAFETAGRGPALIVVSGALSHRGMLRGNPLVPQLAEHFTVYAYDRRGRGESGDTQPYAVQREIEDLDALATHAGGPVYVFGVSSGAALAMQAAAALGPSKIAKLALYEPPYGQDPAAFAQQKQGVAKAIATGKPGDAAALFLTSIGTPKPALAELQRSPQWSAMAKMDFTLAYDFAILGDGAIPEATARAIEVPTLVMTGDKSMPFMGSTGDALAKLLPHGERKVLAGQTHQVQADVVVPLLVTFFAPSSS